MRVSVRLFATAKDLAGKDELEFELPEGTNVAALRQAISDRVPSLAPLLARCLLAVDCQYVGEAEKIPPDAEVAVIPPVSGG